MRLRFSKNPRVHDEGHTSFLTMQCSCGSGAKFKLLRRFLHQYYSINTGDDI